MKLLIVTQALDQKDPILGFFHRWIREFSEHCEKMTVIAQRVGEYDLPETIDVLSLEKEKQSPLVSQVFRFWKLIISKRRSYDRVLVHMTPIWVVLGFPVWFLLRKRMYLWYEARGTRWPLRVALVFLHKVFSASQHGMPLASKKSVITGHGIDTDYFIPSGTEKEEGLIVTVGRLTQSKHMVEMIEAFSLLPEPYHFLIVGLPITPADKEYLVLIQNLIARKDIKRRVAIQSLSQGEVKHVLERAELFLHASETSLDKAVLEAISCGCLVLSSSSAFREFLPEECTAKTERLGDALSNVLSLPASLREKIQQDLRVKVEREHSLKSLIAKMTNEMS